MSGEEGLLDAIRTGKDAHMFIISRMFPEKWAEEAEPNCIHKETGFKCDCPGHNAMRKKYKPVSFGIIYGKTEVGLADTLDVDRGEAREIIQRFFMALPNAAKMLEANGKLAKENFVVVGPGPTYRKRFFHPSSKGMDLSAYERQGKNFPIQCSGADTLKLAFVYFDKALRTTHKHLDVVLMLPVHDEILASCPKEQAEEGLKLMQDCMLKAADFFFEPGLLGSDGQITERWCK